MSYRQVGLRFANPTYLALIHEDQFHLKVPKDFQPHCFYQPKVNER